MRRLQARGATHKQHLGLLRALVISVQGRDLALLATDPEVESISPDHPVFATGEKSNGFTGGPDYGWMLVSRISDPQRSLHYDGSGIGVALIAVAPLIYPTSKVLTRAMASSTPRASCLASKTRKTSMATAPLSLAFWQAMGSSLKAAIRLTRFAGWLRASTWSAFRCWIKTGAEATVW